MVCVMIRNTCGGELSQLNSTWPSFCLNPPGEGMNEGKCKNILFE